MKKEEAQATTLRLLLEGYSEQDVKDWLREAYSARKAPHVLRACTKQLEASANLPREARLGLILLSLGELYRRMVEIGDYAGALKALKDQSILLGLTTTAKEIEGKIEKDADQEQAEGDEGGDDISTEDLLEVVRGTG